MTDGRYFYKMPFFIHKVHRVIYLIHVFSYNSMKYFSQENSLFLYVLYKFLFNGRSAKAFNLLENLGMQGLSTREL